MGTGRNRPISATRAANSTIDTDSESSPNAVSGYVDLYIQIRIETMTNQWIKLLTKYPCTNFTSQLVSQ